MNPLTCSNNTPQSLATIYAGSVFSLESRREYKGDEMQSMSLLCPGVVSSSAVMIKLSATKLAKKSIHRKNPN